MDHAEAQDGTQADRPSVSIVVNTYNRAESLRTTLHSFRRLTYRPFEVVVVNGPSTDHSEAVIEEFGEEVKHLRCAEANLCKSRNIGIEAAAGDIVAFIDDDAIPEPHWLEDLVSGFDHPDVAGVGGLVLDHTGFRLQSGFGMCDRIGTNFQFAAPTGHLSFPGADPFPHLQGGNAAMRRDVLVGLGGFDEEIEYYLDETDLCLRALDAGFELRQVHRAAVHHKFLASHVRNADRVLLDRFTVVKNKFYFALQHGVPVYGTREVLQRCLAWVEEFRVELAGHHRAGRIGEDQLASAHASIERGVARGLEVGLNGTPQLMSEERRRAEPPPFRPFATIVPAGRRMRLCLVSQVLPDAGAGGIGRFVWDLARGLAADGHDVRLITTTPDQNRVDLEDGVWVHRIEKRSAASVPTYLEVPDRIWQNAAAVADEVARIHAYDPVDAVYAPIWDVECLAVPVLTTVPLVVKLSTTMSVALDSHPEWASDPEFVRDFAEPVMALERRSMREAMALHANSRAIIEEVERVCGEDHAPVRLVPLCVDDVRRTAHRGTGGDVTTLFVGRLESRKGVDTLLGAIPLALDAEPSLRFVLVGRDDIAETPAGTFRSRFEELHPGLADRVAFRGELSAAELADVVLEADLFVAPSRFESFGLVFVEAMMHGLPLVAGRGGASTEVVTDGVDGVVVDPEDPAGLAAAIVGLARDPHRRDELARAGRATFLDRFTIEACAAGVGAVLGAVSVTAPDPSRTGSVDLPMGGTGAVVPADAHLPVRFPPAERHELVLVHLDGSDGAVVVEGDGVVQELAVADFGGAPVRRVPLPPGCSAVDLTATGPARFALAGVAAFGAGVTHGR